LLQRPRRTCVTLALLGACLGSLTPTTHAQDNPAPAPGPNAAPAAPTPSAPESNAPAPPEDQPAPDLGPAPTDLATRVEQRLAAPDLDPLARMQLELLRLVNQRRAEAGLAPLMPDARLMASAAEHSADMAAGRFCRHKGRDGSLSRARIRKHGYPHNNWAGENIICSRKTPDAAMKWWMGSGPHRRNILHRHFTHIGIGIDPNGPYGPMWTLNFAAGAVDTQIASILAPPPAPAVAQAPPPAPEEEEDDDDKAPDNPAAAQPPAVAGGSGEPGKEAPPAAQPDPPAGPPEPPAGQPEPPPAKPDPPPPPGGP